MELDSQALDILERCGLRTRQAELERAAQPAIGIRSRRSATDLAPGASRFGGLAWLAAGTSWPIWEGEPLPFLGQINLADVAGHAGAEDLPADGLLQFFYRHADPDQIFYGARQDAGVWRVLYVNAVDCSALEPAGAESVAPRYPVSALAFHSEVTFPDECPFEASHDEKLAYSTFVGEVSKRYGGDTAGWGYQAYGSHRMLGHWFGVQFGDPLAESHATSATLDWWSGAPVAPMNPQDWCLLLQLDSDYDAGLDWAGSGMAYFCIPRGDLRARRFDRAWLIFKAT
jgi:Domain of unknown function (DUF1963)